MKLNLSTLFIAANVATGFAAALSNNAERPARMARSGNSGVEARACWLGEDSGCTDGYCWKSCGDDGEWCWTAAEDDGTGDWLTCDNGSQCNTDAVCGQGCREGDNSCGCSC